MHVVYYRPTQRAGLYGTVLTGTGLHGVCSAYARSTRDLLAEQDDVHEAERLIHLLTHLLAYYTYNLSLTDLLAY